MLVIVTEGRELGNQAAISFELVPRAPIVVWHFDVFLSNQLCPVLMLHTYQGQIPLLYICLISKLFNKQLSVAWTGWVAGSLQGP